MAIIHVLPDLLVNRIAAGEVIERPASAVKELLENSIDSEATRIELTVEDGGRRLIRVTDNGSGMGPDDVALCVVPHATSKIDCEDDLFAIGTMGFRGEALASIGAVSELHVVSRRREAEAGCEVCVAGDKIEGPKAVGAPVGTTVEVRSLFFNVPARQKFLRTAQTEFGHIVEQVARVALAHPRIEFRVVHNGREAYRLPATDSLRTRVADFYGSELAESLIAVRREERGVTIGGFVAAPAQSRSARRWEYTFLNGRFIRDRFVQHAVREAYRGLIDPNRFPVTFLTLTMEPSDVDVNVHPTKIEVRWRDSNLIHSAVLAALRDTFLQRDLTSSLSTGAADDAADDDAESRRQDVRQAIADFFKGNPRPAATASPMRYPAALPSATSGARGSNDPRDRFAPPHESAGPTRMDLLPVESVERDALLTSTRGLADRAMQVHRAYLIAETAEGVIIVDQHALHERVLYEQLRAQVSRGPLESQRLLLPETVEASSEQVATLEVYSELLQRLGLEISPFGPNAVAIHAAPTLLREGRMVAFVRDLIDKLAAGPVEPDSETMLEELLQMMACKAAVKAGDALSPEEVEALLAKRETVERSSNCPHGRPTTLRLTLHDLERQFKRT